MRHAEHVARLDAPETLGAKEEDDFDFACGKARAEAIDALVMAVVEELGWNLFDDDVLDRVRVEHDGPVRARIVVDGEAKTPWWTDRVHTADGRRHWSYEPVSA